MATFAALQKQIEKLTAEAARLKQKESRSVIAQIQQAIAEYGFTPADLFGAPTKSRTPAGKRVAAAPKSKEQRAVRPGAGIAKYRDPATGATWTGFGRAPAWLAGAQDRTPFLIAQAGGKGNGVASPGVGGKRAARKAVVRSAAAAQDTAAPENNTEQRKARKTASKKASAKKASATPARQEKAKPADKPVAKKASVAAGKRSRSKSAAGTAAAPAEASSAGV